MHSDLDGLASGHGLKSFANTIQGQFSVAKIIGQDLARLEVTDGLVMGLPFIAAFFHDGKSREPSEKVRLIPQISRQAEKEKPAPLGETFEHLGQAG